MALWSDEDVDARTLHGQGGRGADGAVRVLVRVLGLVAGLLVLVLVAGSVYAFSTGARQRKLSREADSAQVAADLAQSASFTGIGTIRAKSADQNPAVVVDTIAFPYDPKDGPFSEELARKAPVLRAAALSVFEARKAGDLAPAFEGAIKAALRDAFNARLSLGRVREIWLSDFTVIQ